MQTAGLTMNDVWAHRVMNTQGMKTIHPAGGLASLRVAVDQVDMLHHSVEEKYRPYLHISGSVISINPHQSLPYGIEQIDFPGDSGERIDAYYEFDAQQLQALVAKGYFAREFKVPVALSDAELGFDAQIETLLLEPQEQGEPPVIFVSVIDSGDIALDDATTGLELVQFFSDHQVDSGLARQSDHGYDEHELRVRSDAINSLFSQEEVEQALATGAARASVRNASAAQLSMRQGEDETSSGWLETSLAQREEVLEQQRQANAAAAAQVPHSPEAIYAQQISPRLSRDQAHLVDGHELADADLVTGEDLLDFGQEEASVMPTPVADSAAQAQAAAPAGQSEQEENEHERAMDLLLAPTSGTTPIEPSPAAKKAAADRRNEALAAQEAAESVEAKGRDADLDFGG